MGQVIVLSLQLKTTVTVVMIALALVEPNLLHVVQILRTLIIMSHVVRGICVALLRVGILNALLGRLFQVYQVKANYV